MTKQEVALMLTIDEDGKKQVDIAQMNQVVKKLSGRLKGRHGMAILRALLASLLLVTSACSLLSEDKLALFVDKIEVFIGDLGAGEWEFSGSLKKNGTAWGSGSLTWTCREKDQKLAGCTEPKLTVHPLQ